MQHQQQQQQCLMLRAVLLREVSFPALASRIVDFLLIVKLQLQRLSSTRFRTYVLYRVLYTYTNIYMNACLYIYFNRFVCLFNAFFRVHLLVALTTQFTVFYDFPFVFPAAAAAHVRKFSLLSQSDRLFSYSSE